MPDVFCLPLGPSLGLQLLHALFHHIHPILWRSGIPVSPHFCQVGDTGAPCCSPLPPALGWASLSSAMGPMPCPFRFFAVIYLTVRYPGYSHCLAFSISFPSAVSSPQSWSSALEMVQPGCSFLSSFPWFQHFHAFSTLSKAGQSASSLPLPSSLGR